MKYRQLGKSDLNVSAIGIGTWALGGDFWGNINDEDSIAMIQEGLDNGINLIDTAPAYGAGHSETIVGKALKGRRDKAIVATKCGLVKNGDRIERNLKPESIRKEIDDSLSRLDVDVIDLYQIHWPDANTPLEDTVNELVKLRDAGKLRYIGVSNFDIKLMSQFMETAELISLQPQYSLLARDIEKDILPFCKDNNIGVLSYGSIGGGILSGKYNTPPKFEKGDNRDRFYPFFKEPYWSKVMALVDKLKNIAKNHGVPVTHTAINWVIAQDGISSALVGAKSREQVRQNAKACDWELSRDELNEIESAYQEIFK